MKCIEQTTKTTLTWCDIMISIENIQADYDPIHIGIEALSVKIDSYLFIHSWRVRTAWLAKTIQYILHVIACYLWYTPNNTTNGIGNRVMRVKDSCYSMQVPDWL